MPIGTGGVTAEAGVSTGVGVATGATSEAACILGIYGCEAYLANPT